MTSSPNHWFVQTDFGALLGPMPDEALAELARTGALLVRDQVREGTAGEWCLASNVPGLFDEQSPSLGSLSSTLEDLFAPQTCSPRESATSRVANRKDPPKTAETPVAGELKELEFEIDVPLNAPAAASTPPAIVERLPVQKSIPSPTPAVSPQPAPVRVDDPVPPADLALTPPLFPVWEAPVTQAPRWRPPTATSRPKIRRAKTSWITGTIAAATLLAIVAAWWFWPRQRTDIYASYMAIYKELRQRREEPQDRAGWTEFVTRAKSQLGETVPWLEERAKPGDHEKSLLLYAGRDLQEMLEHSHGSGSSHQKRLNAFFEQLEEIYGSK